MLELLEQRSGYAVRHLEFAVKSPYQIQNEPVCGQIAFVCDLPADRAVLVVVKIVLVFIEDRVVSQPHGLMDLKVEAYRRHFILSLLEYSRMQACSGLDIMLG
jgi:hypothetical protein